MTDAPKLRPAARMPADPPNRAGVRMATDLPARKVTASLLGSAFAMFVAWAVSQFADVEVPRGVHEALILLATFGFGYFVPPASRDEIVVVEDPA